MKSAVLALAACVLLAVPAFAQDASPAAAPPAAGAAGSGGGGKGNKIKAAMQACRTEVQSQNLKGPERKKAVMECVAKEHPEFAGRMQCRQDGMAKNLSGDELKAFVKSCVKSHG